MAETDDTSWYFDNLEPDSEHEFRVHVDSPECELEGYCVRFNQP